MKVKITKRQLKLLMNNLHLIGDRGLNLKMSGKTFKKVFGQALVNESKLYKVNMWFGSLNTATMIVADNNGVAMMAARKMFPKATIFDATEIKCKLH
jgi:hypothetical protein